MSTDPASVPETLQVLDFQISQQHRSTLRQAEQLLAEAKTLVEALRGGRVPTSALNINVVAFLIGDLAKLQTLQDTREMIAGKKK